MSYSKVIKVAQILFLCFAFLSCEKATKIVEQSLIKQVITADRWLVQLFSIPGADVTAEYAPFEFEFSQSGIVTAYTASNSVQGDWKEDLNTFSIQTNFSNAADPLKRFNNVWFITKSGPTFVDARAITANGVYNLKLIKKQ